MKNILNKDMENEKRRNGKIVFYKVYCGYLDVFYSINNLQRSYIFISKDQKNKTRNCKRQIQHFIV